MKRTQQAAEQRQRKRQRQDEGDYDRNTPEPRRHENEEGADQETPLDVVPLNEEASEQEAENEVFDESITKAANEVIRLCLALEVNQSVVSRVKIFEVIKASRTETPVKFESVFRNVNVILHDTFGMQLIGLPDNRKKGENLTDEFHDIGFRAKKFVLVNTLNREASLSHEVEAAAQTYADGCENKESELLSSGLTIVILGVIMLSNNHIEQGELLRHLKAFGFQGLKDTVPVLNYPLETLLRNLERQEYLCRNEIKSANTDSLVEYNIGKRAKAELSSGAFGKLLCELLEISYDESFAENLESSVGDAFKV